MPDQLIQHPPGNYTHPKDPGETTAGGAQRVSITDQECQLLRDAVRPGDHVLEIGTGLGVSTRALAERAALVYTTDPDPWVGSEIAPWLPANVIYLRNSCPYRFYRRPSLVFIDGDHAAEAVERDTKGALSLRPREIWWHDGYMQSVREGIARCGITPELVLVDGQPTATQMLRYLCKP